MTTHDDLASEIELDCLCMWNRYAALNWYETTAPVTPERDIIPPLYMSGFKAGYATAQKHAQQQWRAKSIAGEGNCYE